VWTDLVSTKAGKSRLNVAAFQIALQFGNRIKYGQEPLSEICPKRYVFAFPKNHSAGACYISNGVGRRWDKEVAVADCCSRGSTNAIRPEVPVAGTVVAMDVLVAVLIVE